MKNLLFLSSFLIATFTGFAATKPLPHFSTVVTISVQVKNATSEPISGYVGSFSFLAAGTGGSASGVATYDDAIDGVPLYASYDNGVPQQASYGHWYMDGSSTPFFNHSFTGNFPSVVYFGSVYPTASITVIFDNTP